MNNRTGARRESQVTDDWALSHVRETTEVLDSQSLGGQDLFSPHLGDTVHDDEGLIDDRHGDEGHGDERFIDESYSDERFIDECFVDADPAGTRADEDKLSVDRLMSDSVVSAQIEADRALARQARWLADIYALTVADARRRGLDPGVLLRGVHADLGRALQISERTVAHRMNTAERLVRMLPETLASWADGMLTQRHVEMVVDESVGVPPEALPTWESQVLAEQQRAGLTPAQLRAYARSLREVAEPQTLVDRHRQARSERHLVIEPADDGMAWLSALLPAVEAVGIYQRIRSIAKHAQTVSDEPHRAENSRQGRQRASARGCRQTPERGCERDCERGCEHGCEQGAGARSDNRTFGQLQVDVLRDLLIHGTVVGAQKPDAAEFHGQRLPAQPAQEAASRAGTAGPDATDHAGRITRRASSSVRNGSAPDSNIDPDSGADPPSTRGQHFGEGHSDEKGLGSNERQTTEASPPHEAARHQTSRPGLGAGITAKVTVTVPMMVLVHGAQSQNRPTAAESAVAPGVGRIGFSSADRTSASAFGASAAAGAAGFAWLDGYGPIDDETARELVAGCDDLRRMLTDPVSGVALAYGRKTYRPPAALAAYVRDRDQTCRFPGCATAASVCEIDHTLDWQFDGPTDATNLACLCRRHHVVKHHTSWKAVHIDEHGTLRWTSPTGQAYVTAPQSADRSLTPQSVEAIAQRPAFIDQSDEPAPF
ncbi:HNH endonuclease signature motif containing protein [Pseudoclavibacter sp. 13-3]|uniref:HNH endonuclease signature motif containing protein n=1 Tax=Pseudoclavibacter sp. 13-3 TaxID=2901228 RepID=UPI001E485996|nr:HNH endonuclease signature motif containing protein [Pseudoclavibacter sp. 13-3]MCD7101499.1 HNH endonuclease [Pseudoclavibacter sp. 13-3]